MKQAVVIGGSLAGLLAARALSDHVERVTILERGDVPSGSEVTAGVPQARHLHILLLKGKDILERLFPGLEAELVAAGAVRADAGGEFVTVTRFGRIVPVRMGVDLVLCSRNLVETHVRRRLLQRNSVEIRPQSAAAGLTSPDGGRTVTGVMLRSGGAEPIAADLVVDASGRSSEAAAWLEAFGHGRVETTVVNSHLGYATRWYRMPADDAATLKGILVGVHPPLNPRGGAVFPAEGGRLIVTLAGIAGAYPPTDEAGFLQFAEQLMDPAIAEIIRRAEPLTPIYGYRRTENQWRHFEKLRSWPAGFAVLGDAACGFNPVYGQGMTAAALGADLLGREAAAGRFDAAFGLRFQRRLAQALHTPWLMATGEDFRWESTEGPRPGRASRFVQRYLDKVIRLACRDPEAGRAFIKVVNLLEPPASLFRPSIALPALFGRG